MEEGKCYKTISFNHIVYIFRVKNFTIKRVIGWNKVNKENKYYHINVEIGFLIENNNSGIKRITNSIMKHIDTEFIEIDAKDMDKLVHYYNIMEQSFKAIINKYK